MSGERRRTLIGAAQQGLRRATTDRALRSTGSARMDWRKPCLKEDAEDETEKAGQDGRDAGKVFRYPAANFSSASSEPSEARESTT